MSNILIEWLSDTSNCETCGGYWAEGARVTIDGRVALDFVPVASCCNPRHWDATEVYTAVLTALGHEVVEV